MVNRSTIQKDIAHNSSSITLLGFELLLTLTFTSLESRCRAAQASWENSVIGCLSDSEFPITAHEDEQHRKQAGWGAIFFPLFLLGKQKK
jgi:hypothetical protein